MATNNQTENDQRHNPFMHFYEDRAEYFDEIKALKKENDADVRTEILKKSGLSIFEKVLNSLLGKTKYKHYKGKLDYLIEYSSLASTIKNEMLEGYVLVSCANKIFDKPKVKKNCQKLYNYLFLEYKSLYYHTDFLLSPSENCVIISKNVRESKKMVEKGTTNKFNDFQDHDEIANFDGQTSKYANKYYAFYKIDPFNFDEYVNVECSRDGNLQEMSDSACGILMDSFIDKPDENICSYQISFPLMGLPNNSEKQKINGEGAVFVFFAVKGAELSDDFLQELSQQLFYCTRDFHFSYFINSKIKLLQRYQKEAIKTAIAAILIDSYGHNISAHSLVALENWFRNRDKELSAPIYINDKKSYLKFTTKDIAPEFQENFVAQTQIYYKTLDEDDNRNGEDYITLNDIIRLKAKKEKYIKLNDIYVLKNEKDLQEQETKFDDIIKLKIKNSKEEYFNVNDLILARTPYDQNELIETVRNKLDAIDELGGDVLDENLAKIKEITKDKQEYLMPIPVDYAIWPFIRFLKCKSAFWSGITRDLPFGGEHKSLYNFVYNEFIANPLYVGTIAASEEISKINIRIGIDGHFSDDSNNDNSDKFNKCHSNKDVVHYYDFAQINTSIVISPDGLTVPGISDPAKTRYSPEELRMAKITPKDIGDTFELDPRIDYSDYGFVHFGMHFGHLRDTLKKEFIFLPGGTVGIHAFLTIIENTLRNVKHHKKDINIIKENGLTLILTFQKVDLFNLKYEESYRGMYEGAHRIYKIGIALGHQLENSNDVFGIMKSKVMNEIVESHTGMPRLGGTYQDKICAAMLLKGKFTHVEEVNTAQDYFYYPWIHPKIISTDSSNIYTEQHANKLRDVIFENEPKLFTKSRKKIEYKNFRCDTNSGYLFKFFHIWKTDNVVNYTEQGEGSKIGKILNENDGFSRYKFYIVENIDVEIVQLKKDVRFKNDNSVEENENLNVRDVYRMVLLNEFDEQLEILKKDLGFVDGKNLYYFWMDTERQAMGKEGYTEREIQYFAAYRAWNNRIFTDNKSLVKIFDISTITDEGALIKTSHKTIFCTHRSSAENLDGRIVRSIDDFSEGDVIFNHGSANALPKSIAKCTLNYRSHGELHTNFLNEKKSRKSPLFGIKAEKRDEFIEIMMTKIKIWDNRIYNLIKFNSYNNSDSLQENDMYLDECIRKYQKSLRLHFYQEVNKSANDVTFLIDENEKLHTIYVIHLSFIEEIWKQEVKETDKQKLKMIDWFIEAKLNYSNISDINKFYSFSLCIISGRGNNEWYRKELSGTWSPFVIFKPVESLLNAVADALNFMDDFQLKYNIIKTIIS